SLLPRQPATTRSPYTTLFRSALRLHLGQELELIDETRDELLWILDFPLFLEDEATGRWTFVHHPFTSPVEGHEDLIDTDPGAARSEEHTSELQSRGHLVCRLL